MTANELRNLLDSLPDSDRRSYVVAMIVKAARNANQSFSTFVLETLKEGKRSTTSSHRQKKGSKTDLTIELEDALAKGYCGQYTYEPDLTTQRMRAMILRNREESEIDHDGTINWLAMVRDKIALFEAE